MVLLQCYAAFHILKQFVFPINTSNSCETVSFSSFFRLLLELDALLLDGAVSHQNKPSAATPTETLAINSMLTLDPLMLLTAAWLLDY